MVASGIQAYIPSQPLADFGWEEEEGTVGKERAIGGRREISVRLCSCLCSVPGCIPTKNVSVPPAVLPLDLSVLDCYSDSKLIFQCCHI